MTRPLTRFAAALAAVALAVAPASSTWSIIVCNSRTREVTIASATCLSSFNLRTALPVMKVGIGGACSQSQVDSGFVFRPAMWNGLGAGLSPQEILDQLVLLPTVESRQFGIVNMDDLPVTYSGTFVGVARPALVGVSGDLRYAIQGNLLAGDEPVFMAEQALLNTQGDMTQRVMAAMEAARFWGGDGRCSCPGGLAPCPPLPPPTPFKSAHVGFILSSRIGDTGGSQCTGGTGCAAGPFYLAINIVAPSTAVDPVLQMQQQYATWRAGLVGRPDHLLSTVCAGAQSLVADGKSKTTVTVRLRDVDDNPLASGGAALTLANLSGAPAVTTPSAIVDRGDGSYTFTLSAGTTVGADKWRIVANDGVSPVTLYPELDLRVDALAPLHVGVDELSASLSCGAPLWINAGANLARRPYMLLATTAGTQPGLPFAGAQLPLNSSALLQFTYTNFNTRGLPRTFGLLDRSARAEAAFLPDSALALSLVGSHLDWAGVIFDPLGTQVVGPVGFDVVP
jgi:hypothetical protein